MKKEHSLIIILIFALLFLSIGYATVNTTYLSINGSAGSAENGVVKITNVILKEQTNNITATNPVWSQESSDISFSLSFTLQENDSTIGDERSATYEITVLNDSIVEHSFGPDLFRPSLNISTPSGETLDYTYEVDGIEVGDIIPAKSSVTFTVKLTLFPSGGAGNYSSGVETGITTEEEIEGILIGTFYNGVNTGDLTGSNTSAPLTISVMNTYSETKSFSFSITSSYFSIYDSNNNPNPTFQINGETDSQNFVIYIKKNNNVTFGNTPQRFNLYLNPTDGDNFSIGTVLMSVDVDPNFYDNEPPVITSFSATKVSNKKSISVAWTATDNKSIDHYDLYMYGQKTETVTNLTSTTYTFDNLENGSYSFRLVAYDGKGNHSERTINSSSYSWSYTVTVTQCTNCSGQPQSQTVDAGASPTVTLTGNSGYTDKRPTINSAIMTDSVSNQQIDISGSYNSNNGVLTISNISGNVTISADGVKDESCLAKGTKILLANGTTKNVEDIEYDDLMIVWNYNNGTITYEYPLWIEKVEVAPEYRRITFSDNSYLDIVGDHSLFSFDTNRFFNTSDEEFKVGTRVAKLDSNNTLISVKIKKIETIKKPIELYFIGSTTYYNVFANNILTTDRATMISNLYGFKENVTWPDGKNELVNNNSLDYSYFEDILPYYLYKGFRVKEAGFLVNYGFISLDEFKHYITTFIINEEFIRSPITDLTGRRKWMVTTNLDNVNTFNKKEYLKYEGSYYTLPTKRGVKKWYSTSEHVYYNPGEKVQVWHGMHFIAVKK